MHGDFLSQNVTEGRSGLFRIIKGNFDLSYIIFLACLYALKLGLSSWNKETKNANPPFDIIEQQLSSKSMHKVVIQFPASTYLLYYFEPAFFCFKTGPKRSS